MYGNAIKTKGTSTGYGGTAQPTGWQGFVTAPKVAKAAPAATTTPVASPAPVAAPAPVATASAPNNSPSSSNTLTMAQAAKMLKEQGVPYGGQPGSVLRDWDAISNYLGAPISSSSGTAKASPTGPNVLSLSSNSTGAPVTNNAEYTKLLEKYNALEQRFNEKDESQFSYSNPAKLALLTRSYASNATQAAVPQLATIEPRKKPGIVNGAMEPNAKVSQFEIYNPYYNK